MKKLLAILLSVLLVVSVFCACGAESASDMMMGGTGGASADNGTVKEETSLSSTGNSTGTPQLENQKLVRKVWLDAETDELDPLLAAIDQRIGELSGYVEAREVYNGTGSRSRYANITVRIPAENLDGFIDHVTQNANITSTNETVDNITLSYVATQSRITALETEQTRLLELLAMAENMEDLLKIEERLTDVRTELEEVTSQLRLYDNMVSYGTVYLNIYEVREYTVTEEPETVWERIGTGFMKSLKNLGTFFTELFIFLIVALPYLIPIALVVIVIIILTKRKKQKKQQPPKTEE